ncbi:MAG: cell division protein ZipA C-terminal FtsZ-binding domain-containing protein [Methylobacillus sp.]|jgi:FtsZ-interacting cell division protein ZipA|nr:cell division protein ZipA C-terminal FtsZ-binding domain-containing protein [Methylobacillus sp.]
MSKLQLALLMLGVVVIAAVVIFNWWQERRFMRENKSRFDEPESDILMKTEDFRIDTDRAVAFDEAENRRDNKPADTIPENALLEDLQPERMEPDFSASPVSQPILQPTTTPESAPIAVEEIEYPAGSRSEPEPESEDEITISALPQAVSEQIDLIAEATLPLPLNLATFAQTVQQLPQFDKPVQWLLQDENGRWLPMAEGSPFDRYSQFIAALQLADRAGAVSEGALSAFRKDMQHLATSLNAELTWHGSPDPLHYATELDRFCAGVDVILGFNVLQGSSGPFSGTKLRDIAESSGLRLREDGAFHCEDKHGHTLYTMTSHDQRPFQTAMTPTVFYGGVSFQFEVPRVASNSDAFDGMVLFARHLEKAVNGVLADDNQRALGEVEIEKIRQHLKSLHAKMAARSIQPGTPAALRLFS